MISKGCTNVLRVDGGGSTTMWVEGQGIVENAGPRMVVDCILIVKRDPIDVDIPTIENTSGIEYTTSQLYRQGDASNNWGYAEDNPITYPDETGFSLVDGYLGSSDYNDAAWMGFSSNCPDHKTNGYSYINYDLGSSKYIGKLSAYYGTNALGGGIGAPLSFEVLVSDDGVNYTTVRSGAASNTGISGNSAVGCTELIVNRTARYVQLRMVCNGWGFLCETEFSWATEQEPEGGNTDPGTDSGTDSGTHTHKATGDWIFNETNHWKKCSCGSITNKVSHSFKDGKCSVCGYSKGEEIPEPEYSGLRGDINLDETIGMTDYILLKRYYFGTYTLNEKQILHGDLNEDGTIGMTDYILLKRVYFNTYTLKNPYVYK